MYRKHVQIDLTCTLLELIILRTSEPIRPGRRRRPLPCPSRMVALTALSRRPYVVPGSDSTALMKLSVMAPIEVDSENPYIYQAERWYLETKARCHISSSLNPTTEQQNFRENKRIKFTEQKAYTGV